MSAIALINHLPDKPCLSSLPWYSSHSKRITHVASFCCLPICNQKKNTKIKQPHVVFSCCLPICNQRKNTKIKQIKQPHVASFCCLQICNPKNTRIKQLKQPHVASFCQCAICKMRLATSVVHSQTYKRGSESCHNKTIEQPPLSLDHLSALKRFAELINKCRLSCRH